jgi:hypothetical protein
MISDEIGLYYSIWNLLMFNKIIIYNCLNNEELFHLMIRDSQALTELKKNNAFRIFSPSLYNTSIVLDELTQLGYVNKRKEGIYSVTYDLTLYPYYPIISPIGFTTYTGEIYHLSETLLLTQTEFTRFEKIADAIQNQVKAGKHAHMRKFDFTQSLEFYSDVYEMQNKYFDSLVFAYFDNEIGLYLTEPLNIPNAKGEAQKAWKFNTKLSVSLLYDKNKIDQLMKLVEWKKLRIGLLIRNNKAHWILSGNTSENFHDRLSREMLNLPNFFDKALFDYYNTHSRIFEDACSVFINSNSLYSTLPRQKVGGIELDIYGSQKTGTGTIMCKCKLRFESNPISLEEVDAFDKKLLVLGNLCGDIANRWILTNMKRIEPDALEFAKKKNIKIYQAYLSHNWKNRADWKVTDLKLL